MSKVQKYKRDLAFWNNKFFLWSFWNVLSAGNIWDRSGTENFLEVWDSLKVREFSEDPIDNRNSSGFRVLLAFRPRTSWLRISKLLQKTKHQASYLYSIIIIIIIYWMWVSCTFLKRIRIWAPHERSLNVLCQDFACLVPISSPWSWGIKRF